MIWVNFTIRDTFTLKLWGTEWEVNEVRTRFSLVTSGQISGELLVYRQRGGDTQSKRHSCRSLVVVSPSSKPTEASSLAGHKDVQNKACPAAEGSHITEFWLLRCKWRCSVAAFGNLERWQEQPFAYLFLCPSHCRLEGDVMARATAAIWSHEVTLRMKVFQGRATNRSLGQLRAPQSRKLLLFKLPLFLSLCYLRWATYWQIHWILLLNNSKHLRLSGTELTLWIPV